MFFNNLVGRRRSPYTHFCFLNQRVGARRVAFLLVIRYTPTCYGGYGSHMAIRACESDLLAAIGCGTILFKQLSTAKYICLDCVNQKIHILTGRD